MASASIPHNLIAWCTTPDIDEKLKAGGKSDKILKFKEFEIGKTKSDLKLSGNVHKTITAFKLLGIDITQHPKFKEHKDLIGSIVDKRNNIIHHNDEASDITLNDLSLYISIFIEYSSAILESTFPKKT
ncbi:HEPN domain-containing protein [Stutzerimonas nosocomialis]|uniref:HEPN domain-containing protein n=1 Tax=Stutzerimonas nosocomialis TaxID=1056496 RepID=UPI001107E9CB|nr:HEPN domain-containing protein [Stutzerimonas nosocomialis]